jgi:hypothetical protein
MHAGHPGRPPGTLHLRHADQHPSRDRRQSPETLGASGAALTLFGPREAETLAAASNPASRSAQRLEFTLGQGPARETVQLCRPITAAGRQMAEAWPIYGPAVERLGIRAVAAVPVSTAGASLGALTVFAPPRTHGPDLETFWSAADTLAVSLLSPWGAPDGEEPTHWPPLLDQGHAWAVVNQAAGMVSVSVSGADAGRRCRDGSWAWMPVVTMRMSAAWNTASKPAVNGAPGRLHPRPVRPLGRSAAQPTSVRSIRRVDHHRLTAPSRSR